jgi:hypothetical protein
MAVRADLRPHQQHNDREPTIATIVLQKFEVATPDAPNRSNRNPPTTAPTDSQCDVEREALALLIDDLAANKAGK